MKKSILGLLTLCALLLSACSSGDGDSAAKFSDEQKAIMSIFHGTWADIQFSNLGDTYLSQFQEDPDKIIFGAQNSKVEDMYSADSKYLFSWLGELVYEDSDGERTNYYYYVSDDGKDMYMYEKDTKVRAKSFRVTVESGTKVKLHDADLSLPFIFVMQ